MTLADWLGIGFSVVCVGIITILALAEWLYRWMTK